MSNPQPGDTATCKHCGTTISWASRAPEEHYPYQWWHGLERGRLEPRCPIYPEPIDPDQPDVTQPSHSEQGTVLHHDLRARLIQELTKAELAWVQTIHPDGQNTTQVRSNSHAAVIAADTVIETISSWDALMELLDAHYPESIFPTTVDNPDRDPGPRIISLIRHLDEARKQ